MRRVTMIVAIVLMIGSGMAIAVAQTTNPLTEEVGTGGQDAGCATPIASPMATPEVATAVAAIETVVATAVERTDASPVAAGDDPCVTPEVATPTA